MHPLKTALRWAGLGRQGDLKAHLKVDLKTMPRGQIKIINARERRRRWSGEEKLRIVVEIEEPGTTVSALAAPRG